MQNDTKLAPGIGGGLGLGVALGAALGFLLDNIGAVKALRASFANGIGIAIGAGLGAAFGTWRQQ